MGKAFSGVRLKGGRSRRVTLALLIFGTVGAIAASQVTGSGGASAAPVQYPVTYNLLTAVGASLFNPAASPPGVNVAGCVPSPAHPRPVVLVGGTFSNMTDSWSGIGPILANQGYCVYSASYGGDPTWLVQSIGPTLTSAQTVAAFIDKVRSQTGAPKVDLVGWSQGGLIGEYYLKAMGGASKVANFIGLAPSTHGTDLNGLAYLAGAFPGANNFLGAICGACVDQQHGSAVLNAVNTGPITQPGVKYTVIETYYEFVVTPIGSSFINEPGVNNQWVQNYCPLALTDHIQMTYDRAVWSMISNALNPTGSQQVNCF